MQLNYDLINTLKGFLRSRTVHLNTYVLIAASILVLIFPQIAGYLNNVSIALLAVANIYLRTKTVTSLLEKGAANAK